MSMPADGSDPIAQDDPESPVPRGPWSFLRAGLGGGFSGWGLQLMAGWLCFHVLTATLWALHLRSLAGWSSLPNYWGELITVRDIWELAANGGLQDHPTGLWAPLAAALAMVWFLWAGWQVQARAAQVPGGFKAWFGGFLDALVIAAVPLGLIGWLLGWFLSALAATGIQGLGWLDWVGGALFRLALVSAFFLQAWLCRLDRAGRAGFRLGPHLAAGFRQLWRHPVQWTALVLGGVVLRAGLPFLVLLLGWRLGGGTPGRVWALLGLQILTVLVNAWLIGWFLRVTALFWKNDAAVEAVIQDLEARAAGR